MLSESAGLPTNLASSISSSGGPSGTRRLYTCMQMTDVRIVGEPLPGMPWEEKPAGCIDPVWRFSKNPIIGRHAVACANSVFNSAVVPFQGVFAGVFRVDDRARNMRLHAGRSANGIDWKIENDPIEWIVPDGVEPPEYGYDPRVCRIG